MADSICPHLNLSSSGSYAISCGQSVRLHEVVKIDINFVFMPDKNQHPKANNKQKRQLILIRIICQSAS